MQLDIQIEREFANDLGGIDRCLGGRDYLLDSELSAPTSN
jgi:hypothetical protein